MLGTRILSGDLFPNLSQSRHLLILAVGSVVLFGCLGRNGTTVWDFIDVFCGFLWFLIVPKWLTQASGHIAIFLLELSAGLDKVLLMV